MHVRRYLSFYLFIYREQFGIFIIFDGRECVCVLARVCECMKHEQFLWNWIGLHRANNKCTDCWAFDMAHDSLWGGGHIFEPIHMHFMYNFILYFRWNDYIVVIVLMAAGCMASSTGWLSFTVSCTTVLRSMQVYRAEAWLMVVFNAQAHAAVTFYFRALIT